MEQIVKFWFVIFRYPNENLRFLTIFKFSCYLGIKSQNPSLPLTFASFSKKGYCYVNLFNVLLHAALDFRPMD